MYFSPNTCPVCWKGQHVDGVCSSCNHTQTPTYERRADALPLFTLLKQRYVIGEVLGNGGFGITYSAWDTVNNERVALKELYPRKDVSREMDDITVKVLDGQEEYFETLIKRFQDEAELLQELGKECDIVGVYDRFSENGTVYYTMEYLDGIDLRTYLKRNGPMSWSFLEPRLANLLSTLGTLHAKNLIHRDISPDNLFLTKDSKIRLIDFGSVRTYQGNNSFTVFLKQHFAPWEQYKSQSKQGPYTDIYSLSVTMYMMLSGKLPPKAPDRAMQKVEVVPLRTYCPTLPARVASAIEKGMNLRPEDRFQSAAEYMKALGIKKKVEAEEAPAKTVDDKKQINKRPGLAYWLHGRSGYYSGRRKNLPLNTEITVGRLTDKAVPYPDNHLGVSRNQCSIFVTASGEMFVKDNQSRFGTFLNDRKLGFNWTKADSGSYIRFGSEVFQLYVTQE